MLRIRFVIAALLWLVITRVLFEMELNYGIRDVVSTPGYHYQFYTLMQILLHIILTELWRTFFQKRS